MKIRSFITAFAIFSAAAFLIVAPGSAPAAFAGIDEVAGNISESGISYDGATGETSLAAEAGLETREGMIMPGLNGVNIRSEAWGEIIGKAFSEQTLEIIGEDGDWYIVDFGGKKGYVLKLAMTTARNSASDFKKSGVPGTVRDCVALNVRTGPWGDKIGWLKTGDKVDIIGEDGDWYMIRFKNRAAFVHKKYIGAGGAQNAQNTGAQSNQNGGQSGQANSQPAQTGGQVTSNGAAPQAGNTQANPALPSSGNRLIDWLRQVGFKGEGLRIAWAIAMRESNGIPEIGKGHKYFNGYDWGLFQLNKPTFGKRAWWDDNKMTDAIYNAKIVYDLSKGGTFWVPWGISGDGKSMNASCYKMWSEEKQMNCIWKPYKKWYDKYPLK